MQNFKAKLQNKNSFTYMAYAVLRNKLFSSAIMFISSIILIRALPKEDYGLYILALAFFAFFELLLSGSDASLIRFIPTSGKQEQHRLIGTVLAIKSFITIFILILLFFTYSLSIDLLNISEKNLETYTILYIIISVGFIFKYIITTTTTIINSFMLYDVLFKLTIISSISSLIVAILVSFFELNIWQYLLISTIFAFIYSLLSVYMLYIQNKISYKILIKTINISTIKDIFKNRISSYSLPLFGVSMLSYIKNYLPTYLFGTMVSLETLAVYSIFKKITDFLHKGYAGFIQSLYPKLFKMMHSKNKAIDKLFWIGFGLRVLVFLALYFSYDLILSIYTIKETEYDYLIFVILISSFLIVYYATIFNLIIMNDKTTNTIFKASLLRATLMIIVPILFYVLFGNLGLIVSILVSDYIMVLIIMKILNSHSTNMKNILNYSFILTSFLIICFLISILNKLNMI